MGPDAVAARVCFPASHMLSFLRQMNRVANFELVTHPFEFTRVCILVKSRTDTHVQSTLDNRACDIAIIEKLSVNK